MTYHARARGALPAMRFRSSRSFFKRYYSTRFLFLSLLPAPAVHPKLFHLLYNGRKIDSWPSHKSIIPSRLKYSCSAVPYRVQLLVGRKTKALAIRYSQFFEFHFRANRPGLVIRALRKGTEAQGERQ